MELAKYISDILVRGKEWQKQNVQLFKRLKHKKGLEKLLPEAHEQAFAAVNCLDCGNCCKSISPRFKTPDIKRISKFMGMKESHFIEQYLRLDTDGDYVVHRSPCPFLLTDNSCEIYEVRPGDCANYPYTDSGHFFKYPSTTIQNTAICPAVNLVMDKLRHLNL